MNSVMEGFVRTQATQEIECLRRWYAKATDLIGMNTTDSIAEGRAIYRKIFTEDIEFDVVGQDGKPLPAKGPDAWVDVVLGVLGPMGPTQHFIGTQLVELGELDIADDGSLVSGDAKMESYLHGWHEQSDEKVWLYLGTYYDEAKFVQGKGWQISAMRMHQFAGETRFMDAAVAGV